MTTPAPLPTAPTSASATAIADGVSVAFLPSDNAVDAAVNSYTVLAQNLTTGEQDAAATGPDSPILVQSLTRNCNYAFTVIANGSSGASPPSDASNTVQPLSTPDPPTTVTATPGDTTAAVAFSPPGNTGGTSITSYTVTATDLIVAANGGQTVSASGSPITVTGLTNGDSYTFSVVATNLLGNSLPSQPSPVCVPVAATVGGVTPLFPNSLQFTVTKKINQIQLADEIEALVGVPVTLALQLESTVAVASPAHPGTLHVTPDTVSSSSVQDAIDDHVADDSYGLSEEAENYQRILQMVVADHTVTLSSDDLQTAVRELLLQLNLSPFLFGDSMNVIADDYLTASQTVAEITGGIENHNVDLTAHPDIRELIGSTESGGGSGTPGGVPETREVIAGSGLTGGGDLADDVTLAVSFGIASGTVCQGNDSRLSNSRMPTLHAATHATGSTDPVSPASIGAALSGHVHLLEHGAPVALTDSATISTDASSGNYFRVSINGNRTLGAPSNPTDGQMCTWEITAAGGTRTLALTTGNGGFEAGSVVAPTTSLVSGQHMILRAAYNASANRWFVMSAVPQRQLIIYTTSAWTFQPNVGSPLHIVMATLGGSEVARLDIPDPGFPYRIESTAQVEIQPAAGERWDVEFRLDSVVSGTRFGGYGTGVLGTTRAAIVPQSYSDVLTGAHTLYLVGYGVGGGTSQNGWITNFTRYIGVKLLPQ